MNTQLIEIAKLGKSPLNVRKTVSKAAGEELKASILAHGLMQNLVVVPVKKGRYHVIAGGRRLDALNALIDEGSLPADHAVPCQIADESQAHEMSLAENTVRAAMHPADEFEAFAELADKGRTAAEIAERFGVTEKHVLQRLRLGRLAPELLAEYRAGSLDLECLTAFTITDDRKRQLDLYRSLQGWQKNNARHIRGCLTDKMTGSDDKLAQFVGLDAYQAAGGRLKSDLFGEDVYLEDTALLTRLAGERLEAEAAKLRAEGWGWVEAETESEYGTLARYGRIRPEPLNAPAELVAELEAAEAEQERLSSLYYEAEDNDESEELERLEDEASKRVAELEEKLESFTGFDPEKKKLAGCFVSIGWGGKLSVEKGLVKPEDKKKLTKEQPVEAGGEAAEPAKPGLPQSLIDDLKRYRTQAAQAEIAMHPAIAFDLLVFQTARDLLGHRPSFDGPKVSFHNQYIKPGIEAETLASRQLEALKESLSLDWLKAKTEPAQFAAFQSLPEADKHRLLAYCTALTLQPKLAPGEGRQATAYDIALAQTGASMAEYWRPTAANFLSRIKVDQLLEIGAELFGQQWATHRRNAKKKELVAELDKAFAHPDKALDPEKVRRIASWLPEGMELGRAEPEPEPAKAKKAKKAA